MVRLASGCRDAHPAVDVGQDPAKQPGWRGALKVGRHVTVRQGDRQAAEHLGGESGSQPGRRRGQQVTGGHDGKPGHMAPVTPSRRPAGRTNGRPASRPADAAASSTPTATGPALKVNVARNGRMRSSGAENSTTTQKPRATARQTAYARRTRARHGRRGRTRRETGRRCPAAAPAGAGPEGPRSGT